MSDFLWPHELQHARPPCPSQLPESTPTHSIESVMPSNHLILFHPFFLLPSIFPSIRIFSNESALHIRWPKYCSFSFSISPSNEHSGLISFRVDLLDSLAVQGTRKNLLQYNSSKASILQCSTFFIVELITWTTALSNSMKLRHAMWGHPRWTSHGGEVWQNVVHWRRQWQTTSVLLLWEPHEQKQHILT